MNRSGVLNPAPPMRVIMSPKCLGWIAMKLGRKLRWDPAKEAFLDDDQANAMRSRPQRAPYGTDGVMKKT